MPEMIWRADEDSAASGGSFTGVIVGIIDDSVDVYLKVVSEDGVHFSEVHMLPKYAMALGQALIVAATRYN